MTRRSRAFGCQATRIRDHGRTSADPVPRKANTNPLRPNSGRLSYDPEAEIYVVSLATDEATRFLGGNVP